MNITKISEFEAVDHAITAIASISIMDKLSKEYLEKSYFEEYEIKVSFPELNNEQIIQKCLELLVNKQILEFRKKEEVMSYVDWVAFTVLLSHINLVSSKKFDDFIKRLFSEISSLQNPNEHIVKLSGLVGFILLKAQMEYLEQNLEEGKSNEMTKLLKLSPEIFNSLKEQYLLFLREKS